MQTSRFVLAAAAAFVLVPQAAASQIMVANETTHEQEASPGDRQTGRIVVRNTTDQPQEVRIRGADYSFSADGRNSFGNPASTPRSNAAWLQLSASQVTIGPREDAVISYVVTVPADSAGLSGTYWSVVLVESAPSAAGGSEKGKVGLQTVVRYGVQIATHIAGTGTRQNAIAAARLLEDGEAKALELDIANPGERAYRLAMRLDIFGADGALAGSVEQKTSLIYPGTSIRRRFALGKLRPGTYTAMLVADTGAAEVFGAQYTLKF